MDGNILEEQNRIILEQQEKIKFLEQQMNQNKNVNKKKKVNPYKILEIPKDYDENMLKQCYMKKAMIMHPDRGGNPNDFKILVKSYKSLQKKLEDKKINDHNELKKHHDIHLIHENENRFENKKLDKNNFNVDTFNQLYDENRLEDKFTDTGYGNWLKKEKEEHTSNINSDNFTNTKFNSEFNKYKSIINNGKSQSLTETEPKELLSLKNQDSLTLLGRGKVKNYSGSVNGLGYRDLKDAYENPVLINVDDVDISNRDTDVMYYEKNRENISYEMNESELERYNKNFLLQQKNEEKRLNRLQKQDNIAGRHHELLHQRLLG